MEDDESHLLHNSRIVSILNDTNSKYNGFKCLRKILMRMSI